MTQTCCALPKRASHQYIQHGGGDLRFQISKRSPRLQLHFFEQFRRQTRTFQPPSAAPGPVCLPTDVHTFYLIGTETLQFTMFSANYTLCFSQNFWVSHTWNSSCFLLTYSTLKFFFFFYWAVPQQSAPNYLFTFIIYAQVFFSNLELWFLNEGWWSFQEKGYIRVGWFEIITTLS